MKIKKKGDYFIAYRDENDLDTSQGGEMNPRIKVGDSLGDINIKTGRFKGNTVCLVELDKHRDEFLKPQKDKYEELINEVIDSIKSDVANGDVTVLDELLRFIPKRNLIQSLSEERWSEFDEIKDLK